jgi:hypothetical protein
MNFIYLFIYIQIDPKEVGKPTGYGTSQNVLNLHKKQLCRRITRLGSDDWLYSQELVKQKCLLFKGGG